MGSVSIEISSEFEKSDILYRSENPDSSDSSNIQSVKSSLSKLCAKCVFPSKFLGRCYVGFVFQAFMLSIILYLFITICMAITTIMSIKYMKYDRKFILVSNLFNPYIVGDIVTMACIPNITSEINVHIIFSSLRLLSLILMFSTGFHTKTRYIFKRILFCLLIFCGVYLIIGCIVAASVFSPIDRRTNESGYHFVDINARNIFAKEQGFDPAGIAWSNGLAWVGGFTGIHLIDVFSKLSPHIEEYETTYDEPFPMVSLIFGLVVTAIWVLIYIILLVLLFWACGSEWGCGEGTRWSRKTKCCLQPTY